MKECNCLNHEGPHWLHMDELWKGKSHELLVQAMRYIEAGKASSNVTEFRLYLSACEGILMLHAQYELARLAEKLKQVENKEHSRPC